MLTVTGLRVDADGKTLVQNVSMNAGRGEWVGVIGPNGAGKTTLLRAIAGVSSFRGSIHLDGVDVARMRQAERAKHIAYSPQEPVLPQAMSVLDFVMLARSPYIGFLGTESSVDRRTAHSALERLDLTALADRRLSTLSGGERRRAAVAQAITQDTQVLLLDEPTSALDLGHQQSLLELIDRLRKERRISIVSALHDLTLAAQYCDRLVLLTDGTVVANGPPAELLSSDSVRHHFGAAVRVIDLNGSPAIHPVRE